eukprot:c20532_g2_i8.p1 GENE.c20532_g2_i8~~c20532_g2_i8.p1  ORF type:complete len:481 (-),score=98.06 c20532_g2_i8:387-1787(-)
MSEASWEVVSSAASTQQDWEQLSDVVSVASETELSPRGKSSMNYAAAARKALESNPDQVHAKPRARVGQVFRVPEAPKSRRQLSEISEDLDAMLAPISFNQEGTKAIQGGGHSVHKICLCASCTARSHIEKGGHPLNPPLKDGPIPLTQLDLDVGVCLHKRSFDKTPLQDPGYRQALIDQASAVTIKRNYGYNNQVRTIISLPVVGHILPASMSKDDRAIAKMAQPAPKKRAPNSSDIFAQPKNESHFVEPSFLFSRECPTPAEVLGSPKLAVSLKSRVPTVRGFATQSAFVTKSSPKHCWVPLGTPRTADLDVDLGREMTVVAVSTKGCAPEVVPYPHDDQAKAWGYSGPRYNVLASKQPWVVKSYELLYRLGGGRDWVSLGLFKGNSDYTTEVAHSLKSFAPPGTDGIKVQHLRFHTSYSNNNSNNGTEHRTQLLTFFILDARCSSLSQVVFLLSFLLVCFVLF